MHHSKSIGEFKLDLQSQNAQFGSKSAFFVSCDLEIWTLSIILKPSVNSNWSYSPETPNSGQNRRFCVPCDLEIWRMTLKNNRAPLLCCFKLCLSFRSHQRIQPGVTVRKRPIGDKIDDFFLSHVTLKFHGWHGETIGHLFYPTCIIS